jgi:hypothetical protein
MARIRNRIQTAGDLVAGVEGTTVWNTNNLTYSFATNADAALVTTDGLGPPINYTGVFKVSGERPMEWG